MLHNEQVSVSNEVLELEFDVFLFGRTVGQTDGRTVGRSDGRTVGRSDGRTVGRTVGRTDGRTCYYVLFAF